MKALVKKQAEPGLWMDDVATPTIGPNDLLIKIRKTAICGTDIHIQNWDDWARRTIPVPLVVGHEFVGDVAALGSAVTGFTVGERVSGEGHLTCGHCRNCRAGKRHLCHNSVGIGVQRPGCFAEFLALPAGNAFRVPAAIPDDVAAFLDPLGNATHTTLSFDLVGEDVLITGAGPIGIMSAAIARHIGARHIVITDVNDFRLDLARKMGATRAINIRTTSIDAVMKDLGMTEGFDVGLEMSGSPDAFRTLLKAMNHGGRVAILGIPPADTAIDWNDVIFKGLILKGIYGREMFETWYKMAAMLQGGLDVTPVITHHFAAADFARAFDAMRSGASGKVILDWT
ncbi:MAG: L-threonine 3-dehydrogenase [Deltaproteobacteria bacterium]|nr:L-threonine 3-dehydrogenase [Deltaproteobacteria bacterium]